MISKHNKKNIQTIVMNQYLGCKGILGCLFLVSSKNKLDSLLVQVVYL